MLRGRICDIAHRNKDRIHGLLFNIGIWVQAGRWLSRNHTDKGTQGIAGREEQNCGRKEGRAAKCWHLRSLGLR